MILPDVNVLVFAHRREAANHDRYAAWLANLIGGADDLALAESCLTGFVRIVTNARIMSDPTPTTDAIDFVDALRHAARARRLSATPSVWATFADIAADDPMVRGNLVPDAWLAALARSHGCHIATADRGFARFVGLRWFDPAA